MKVTPILVGHVIKIRISHEGIRTMRTTHIHVEPSQFQDGKVTRHPKATEYNKRIKTLIIQCQAQALEGRRKKTPKVNFYQYAEGIIAGLTRKPGSLRQYQSQITKLKEFKPSFYLSDIDHALLDDYKAFLKARGNEGNTIWSSFKFLRKFIRHAFKARVIPSYPFDNYEFPPYVEPDKVWLTVEEMGLIDKLAKLDVSDNLKEAANWFLIACYTGLRISDIKVFDKKRHIINGRLIMRTQKTREPIGLPLEKIPEALSLLERIQYKRLSMHENTYNDLLKIVASAAGIDKPIASHTARHTAAMRLANKGFSQEVVAKVLGHADMRSTKTYFKITNTRIDLEFDKLK